MIETIIKASVKHWLVIIVATIGFSFIGYRSLTQIPLDAIPDLSDIQVIVFSEWKGKSPDLMEDQVTYPIITSLLGAPKVKYVRGQSFFGLSFVNVIFEDGTDLYWARSRVMEYISSVKNKLPEGVNPELGPDATGVGWVFQYALKDTSGLHSLEELRRIQDWIIQYNLKAVSGVAEVASVGGFQKQYQIRIDPNKLHAYNISIKQIVTAVQKSNIDVGARVIEISGTENFIRGRGYIKSVQDLEIIPIKEFNGTPILLKQLGRVSIGSEMRRGAAELDGMGETVGGIVVMRWGKNALEVIEKVKEKIKEIQRSLPEGVEIVSVYDRSGLINSAIKNLIYKLAEEIIVVILIIGIFLWHFKSALIAVIPLPVAILIAFIPMELSGLTANIMSLSGIAIAIGAMIDASIILVENAHKHLERYPENISNHDRLELIAVSMAEMGRPLFFSLIVITVSFLPVFVLTGQEGRLFTPLAMTKTLSMAVAAILAITLTPALAVPFLKGKIPHEKDHPISNILRRFYHPFCSWVLHHKRITIAFTVALILSIIPVYLQLGSEFMPPLNEGSILYMPTAVPGMSIESAVDISHRIGKNLKKNIPEIEHIFTKVGRSNSPTDSAPLSMIEAVITLKPLDQWRENLSMDQLIKEMDQISQIPGMPNIWWMPIQTRTEMLATGIRSALGIKVLGSNLKEVEKVGAEIEKAITKLKGTRSAFSERATGGYFIDFEIDRVAISRYGLSVQDTLEALSIVVGGKNVTTTVEGRERFSINIRYHHDFRQTLQSLNRILITTPKGIHIPISQLAKLEIKTGPPMIRNENGKIASFVFVDIDQKKVSLGDYVQAAKDLIQKEVKLPSGVSLDWAGQYQNLERAKQTFQVVVPITLLLVLILIYINTGNLTETLIVMLAVPFSLVGAFWFLWGLDYNLSVAVWVGLIALAGLDAETGVVMLLYLKMSLDDWIKKGKIQSKEDFNQAIIEGAVQRIRPKMMTAAAILFGLIPIMWGDGSGSQVMKRIAAPMIGGIITSVVLELLVYPVVFSIWKEKSLSKF